MTTGAAHPRAPTRIGGYAPIRDYAVIGNKRTAALVALDGAIDWLPLPTLEGPSVFAGLLDRERGGSATLAPVDPFTVKRRYIEDTNVLETTFHTAQGSVRVTDAMSRPVARGLLFNQVIRRVDGLAGEVAMRWRVSPRFDYGQVAVAPRRCGDHLVFLRESDALAVEAFGVGEPEAEGQTVGASFVARPGDVAVLALSAFHEEPVTFSPREHLLNRLQATAERWRHWITDLRYDGPWAGAVRRSALALDLLVDDESGAIAAAATMGLPERVGGDRNYDYRYAWLRDCNLTLEAMLRLGFRDQVHTSMGWVLRSLRGEAPWPRPMYRLGGGKEVPCRQLALAGYRGSRPVLLGNAAQSQLQVSNFGDVFDMAWHYCEAGGHLLPEEAGRLAGLADSVCQLWRHRESGLWELPDKRHYTQGKLAAWLALQRAIELAGDELPVGRLSSWRREAAALERFIAEHCWSAAENSFAMAAGTDELDAAVLLAARGSFLEDDRPRLDATIDAVRRALGAGGPLLYRYGRMRGQEGAFLACSFWLAEALARAGRIEEAAETMDDLVGLSNDVGLFSEQIDPDTGDFLGNLPQALTHLAAINAASVLAGHRRPGG